MMAWRHRIVCICSLPSCPPSPRCLSDWQVSCDLDQSPSVAPFQLTAVGLYEDVAVVGTSSTRWDRLPPTPRRLGSARVGSDRADRSTTCEKYVFRCYGCRFSQRFVRAWVRSFVRLSASGSVRSFVRPSVCPPLSNCCGCIGNRWLAINLRIAAHLLCVSGPACRKGT